MSDQPQSSGEPDASSDAPEVDAVTAARAANRFDVRRIIGALFLLYSVILIVVGIVGSTADKNKAAGINVNLWTGLGMLVFGAGMIAWALLRPVVPDPSKAAREGSGPVPGSPATEG